MRNPWYLYHHLIASYVMGIVYVVYLLRRLRRGDVISKILGYDEFLRELEIGIFG